MRWAARACSWRLGLLAMMGSVAGCSPHQAGCLAPGSCGNSGLPPPDSQRMVVSAEELAVVSSRGQDAALPEAIALGGVASGSVVVLLRFPAPWGNRVRIERAF